MTRTIRTALIGFGSVSCSFLPFELLFEASPADLQTGEPSLSPSVRRWGAVSRRCWPTRGLGCWRNPTCRLTAIKLLASAERQGDSCRLSVAPTVPARSAFLGQWDGWEMRIERQSDLYGRMYRKIREREPLPTAAAMLRDAVNILG